jgi:hypothetical protein
VGGGKARIRAFFFFARYFRFFALFFLRAFALVFLRAFALFFLRAFALFFLRAFALFLLLARVRESAKKVPAPTFDLMITKDNKNYNKKMNKK